LGKGAVDRKLAALLRSVVSVIYATRISSDGNGAASASL
jgi:hypothetical protein